MFLSPASLKLHYLEQHSPNLLNFFNVKIVRNGNHQWNAYYLGNSYDNKDRTLEYIRIVLDDVCKCIIPDRYKNKYGIWLIGYVGGDKLYSYEAASLI